MPDRFSEKHACRATRRQFLGSTAAAAVLTGSGALTAAVGTETGHAEVALIADEADAELKQPPVQWAIGELQGSLKTRGITALRRSSPEQASREALVLLLAGGNSPRARQILQAGGVALPRSAESLALVSGRIADRPVLLVTGADVRGLVYAVLELADRVRYASQPAADLRGIRCVVEQPANAIRSIARLFTSDVEDKPWFYDKPFWQRYLSMLASQRFNRFNLTLGLGYDAPRGISDSYFYFAYPFLVSAPGYEVEAVGLPREERERNLAMLHWISEEATHRGLHFQLALWTHAYHFYDSPKVNYPIRGLTPQNHAAYCRDALQRLLTSCPAISGITFRSHSESGIPEGSYPFWRTVFEGVARAGRRVEIDIHSKGIEHKLLEMALETGQPVNVSPKYWAEHMGLPYHQAAIRRLEWNKPSPDQGNIEQNRRFTRYGYADYLREDRRYGVLWRIWPGTQRLLLWGDPALAAGYGRYAHFCGSNGLELCEPLSFKGRKGSGRRGDRNGYADASLRPSAGDFEKHLYTYRLWGRLLYNPEAPRESWSRFLTVEFGPAAADCEAALAHASRVLPLVTTAHDPSASNNAYWPEIYSNMPIVDPKRPHPYGDTVSPKRFGAVSPLDPVIFSAIDEFAEELASGRRSGRYSPLDVARWLDHLAGQTAEHLAQARKTGRAGEPRFRRLAIDAAIQAGLGRFFAEKLRAAVAYAVYQKTGEEAAIDEAMKRYGLARDAWAKFAAEATGVYADDLTFGASPHLRGHWADRLAAIDADRADMRALAQGPRATGPAKKQYAALWAAYQKAVIDGGEVSRPQCHHVPASSFRPGKPIPVEITVEAGRALESIRLHYRHVNQADEYQRMAMSGAGRCWRATIPGEYTESPYPLLYFFELHGACGDAWLYPGLNEDLANQPYFTVPRQPRRP